MSDDKHEVVEGHEGVLKGMTEQQIAEAREQAVKFVTKDPEINRISAVVIASRQLYSLARLALTRELIKEGHEWSDGVEEYIIQAMVAQANEPFSRDKVLQATQGQILPFLVDDVEREIEETNTDELEFQRLAEAHRADSVVPITSYGIRRSESQVLVGPTTCITERIDEYLVNLNNSNEGDENHPCVVLHLVSYNIPDNIMLKEDQLVIEIGLHKWVGCTNSPAKLRDLFAKYLKSALNEQCDLLLVDDLVQTYTAGSHSLDASGARRAEKGHKALKKWAKSAKAAVIGGARLPKGEDMVEFVQEVREVLGDHVGVVSLSLGEECGP